MKNKKVKGTEEQGSDRKHFKSKKMSLPYLPKGKVRGRAPHRRQGLCCFICEYATSRVPAHTQLEPPLSGGTHSASRAVLIKLTLLSRCAWARSMFSKAGSCRHARILHI